MNVIGGFALGMIAHGMGATEAGEAYVTLAVGDALVAQVPALLLDCAQQEAAVTLDCVRCRVSRHRPCPEHAKTWSDHYHCIIHLT